MLVTLCFVASPVDKGKAKKAKTSDGRAKTITAVKIVNEGSLMFMLVLASFLFDRLRIDVTFC